MADITMCCRKDCVDKKKCLRYIAVPSTIQSYFNPLPNLKEGEVRIDKKICPHYWRASEGAIERYNARTNGK